MSLPGGSVGPHGRLPLGPAIAVIVTAVILSAVLYWVLTIPFKEEKKAKQGTETFEDWLLKQALKD